MDDSNRPSTPDRTVDDAGSASGLSPREAERESLRALREHVTGAVEEIVRLRAQNKSLARRLSEFEAQSGGTASVFTDEGDVTELKAKLSSFIASIDAYLGDSEEA